MHNKKVEYIDIHKIQNDLWDARINSDYSDDMFKYLKQSIAADGLLDPIRISPKNKSQNYSIVDGRRRLEAMRQLGYKEIECFVIEGKNPEELAAITMISNLHRKNLNDVERCTGIAEIFNKLGYSVDDVISNCKRIHNKQDYSDPVFLKTLNAIGYSANFVYQLMQLIRDMPLKTLKLAEKSGLSTHQKILLTNSKLKEHPEIQKDLVEELKNIQDIKLSRIRVYQAIRDLETGALYESDGKYRINTYLRDKVTDYQVEYAPIKNYLEILKSSNELMKYLTGHQLTQGEYEYTKDNINYSAKYRMDIIKNLDSRQIVALIEQLRMLQYAIESMESIVSGEVDNTLE